MGTKILDVYVSPLPSCESLGTLIPKERDDEVRAVGSEKIRREKYFVWRLLEEAILSSFGAELRDAGLYRSESGKWMSKICEISLSHSGGLLAVAVSSEPVGIDIEGVITPRAARFAERTLTEKELSRYNLLPENEKSIYLTECWTKKEAYFKMTNSAAFIPSAYETERSDNVCRHMGFDGKKYVLAIASDALASLKFKKMI